MKKIFEKYPLLRYILGSYVKTFLGTAVTVAALCAVLIPTGIYSRLESILDLKYNSPFVLGPLFGFAGMALICLLVGSLMYFIKYKRNRGRSTFYKSFSNILNEAQSDGEK